jgi:NAD-dependent deacetylase
MKKIVILSGAGISAESGISTFRDSGGLWEQHDVMDVASVAGWKKNPALVLEFYNLRRSQLEGVEPNRAHFDIAALEKDYDVVVITQNVDNLHEKAGSSKVIHLHGELTKVRPEDSYTEADVYDESRVKDIGYSAIGIGDVDERGVQYRPHIVFFGEAVPKLSDALRELVEADIMIIVGTSLVVQPAASLWQFTPVDCPVYVVDPEDTPIDREESVIHIKDNDGTDERINEFSIRNGQDNNMGRLDLFVVKLCTILHHDIGSIFRRAHAGIKQTICTRGTIIREFNREFAQIRDFHIGNCESVDFETSLSIFIHTIWAIAIRISLKAANINSKRNSRQ